MHLGYVLFRYCAIYTQLDRIFEISVSCPKVVAIPVDNGAVENLLFHLEQASHFLDVRYLTNTRLQ